MYNKANNQTKSKTNIKMIVMIILSIVLSLGSYLIQDTNILVLHSPTYNEINTCYGFPLAIYCEEKVAEGVVGVPPINESILFIPFLINTIIWFLIINSLPLLYARIKKQKSPRTHEPIQPVYNNRGHRRVG